MHLNMFLALALSASTSDHICGPIMGREWPLLTKFAILKLFNKIVWIKCSTLWRGGFQFNSDFHQITFLKEISDQITKKIVRCNSARLLSIVTSWVPSVKVHKRMILVICCISWVMTVENVIKRKVLVTLTVNINELLKTIWFLIWESQNWCELNVKWFLAY